MARKISLDLDGFRAAGDAVSKEAVLPLWKRIQEKICDLLS
jgi:hypothetical protein